MAWRRWPIQFALLAILPFQATGQLQGPPAIDAVVPLGGSTRHAVNPRVWIWYSMGGDCLDDGSGDCAPIPSSLIVRINGGSNLASGFSTNADSAWNGTGTTGVHNFSGSLGSTTTNSLFVRICNVFDCRDTTLTVYISPDPDQNILTSAHSQTVFLPERCPAMPAGPGAVFACDGLVVTHHTPGYVSRNRHRSVTLVYSSRAASARLRVPFRVSAWGDANASTVQAWTTGSESTYWDGGDWESASGTMTRQIVLERPAPSSYVGRDAFNVTVRFNTILGAIDSTRADTLPYYFARDTVATRIAPGWEVAGISRLYKATGPAPGTGAPSGVDLLRTGAAGSVALFRWTGSAFARPNGVLATLATAGSGEWDLTFMDGTVERYVWSTSLGYARLTTVTDPEGVTTVTYSGSGSGAVRYLIDPQGDTTRFSYHGPANAYHRRLYYIVAPLNGSQADTTWFYYTVVGADTVVDRIRDPDGQSTYYAYAASGGWTRMTGIKPPGGDWYTIDYWSATRAPNGMILPIVAGDTSRFEYVAPQLAGFALTGGTSGSPAAAPHADSAWGFLENPAGQTLTVGGGPLGDLTYARDPAGNVTTALRNADGLATVMTVNGESGFTTYNGLGAPTVVVSPLGDSTFVTYVSNCSSYPCRPSQAVRRFSGYVPDTTLWLYTTGVVPDSVYRARVGWHRAYGAADGRPDSTTDPQGHTLRYLYDATWGNTSHVLEPAVTVKVLGGSPFSKADSTVFTFNGTGRIATSRNGNDGRLFRYYYDRLGRDTTVVDITADGTDSIVTRTRYNDATRTVTIVDGRGNTVQSLMDTRGRPIRGTDAMGRTDTLRYGTYGRLTSLVTRRGDTLSFTYNADGQVATTVVPGHGTWTFGYNATTGALDTLATPNATIYWTRDDLGRVTEERTVVLGVSRTLEYTFDAAGVLTTLTDPWNGDYDYAVDPANRALAITNPFDETFTLRVTPEGLLRSVAFPAGSPDSLLYNAQHQVTSAGSGPRSATPGTP